MQLWTKLGINTLSHLTYRSNQLDWTLKHISSCPQSNLKPWSTLGQHLVNIWSKYHTRHRFSKSCMHWFIIRFKSWKPLFINILRVLHLFKLYFNSTNALWTLLTLVHLSLYYTLLNVNAMLMHAVQPLTLKIHAILGFHAMSLTYVN